MSTPEQPAAPALTRKQMRELRDTGSNPIVSAPAEPEADSTPTPPPLPAPPVMPPSAVAPLPRAADPVVVAEPPVPDAAVDLGVSPLTRRQARQQERIRTASVPVITPELAAAQSASVAAAASTSSVTAVPAPTPVAVAAVTVPNDERPEASLRDLFGLPATTEVDVVAESPADPWSRSGEVPVVLEVDEEPAAAEAAPEVAAEPEAEPEAERATVNPMFGAGLLAAEPAPVDLSPSFDQLLGRSAGTGGTPHALIVPQSSAAGPIVAPVSSTGELLVTGTLNLPEGLGSNGHAPGADGKAIDASLVDGEIPAHSSPTPIAASAAISTVKTPGEIIKPPAPEKGSKLMMTLAITAGVLALALVGVLILAFVTGVF
jgi:hypothetical protein